MGSRCIAYLWPVAGSWCFVVMGGGPFAVVGGLRDDAFEANRAAFAHALENGHHIVKVTCFMPSEVAHA